MRCISYVLDKTTKRFRRCKLSLYYGGHCYIHSQKRFGKSVETIQRTWRGFFARKKLNSLFINLPTDVQGCVLKYIRMDHNIEKKWIPSVKKVLINRVYNIVVETNNLMNSFARHEISEEEYMTQTTEIEIRKRELTLKLDLF
jgi:hypothetical protein